MQSKRTRLDRLLSRHFGINRRAVKPMLAQQRIFVDGVPATSAGQLVGEFTQVRVDGHTVQARQAIYLMLHKPAGVVSATRDDHHTTVIDLIDRSDRGELHIAGRLDFNSTGLVLLTNDGRWSRHLGLPTARVVKRYHVTLAHPINEDYVTAFAEGMHFAYEGITTRPAKLEIIDEHTAEVFLEEGRYHQIKRMFGRFQNPVLTLHRRAIGAIQLDPLLAPGASRELTPSEVGRTDQTAPRSLMTTTEATTTINAATAV